MQTVKDIQMLVSAASEEVINHDGNLSIAVGYSIGRAKLTPTQAKTFLRKFKESLDAFTSDTPGQFTVDIRGDVSELIEKSQKRYSEMSGVKQVGAEQKNQDSAPAVQAVEAEIEKAS